MKSHQVTIKDIAKTLGISISTVSRALKNHPDISEETKLQVKNLARKLNYEPNALALSLRKNKSNTIGVIIPPSNIANEKANKSLTSHSALKKT